MKTQLILASQSPVRRRLLQGTGLTVDCIPARIDEDAIRTGLQAQTAPRDMADALAEAKAQKVSGKHPDALVLGCDQILAIGDKLVTKSASLDAARATLTALRGRQHQLYSAVVLYREGRPIWRHIGVVRLTMRAFSDDFLEAYLSRNWPGVAGAVGAYHLEGEGVRLFSAVRGDYFHVLGLPLIELLSYLTTTGELRE